MPNRGLKKRKTIPTVTGPSITLDKHKDEKISSKIEDTIAFIEDILGVNGDLTIRRFHVFGKYPAVIMHFSNMINQNAVNMDIVKPLMYNPPHLIGRSIEIDQLKDVLQNDALYHSDSKLEGLLTALIESILRGSPDLRIQTMEIGRIEL